MLQIAHILLMSAYIALPPAMLIGVIAVNRKKKAWASRAAPQATVAIATSLLLGISATIIYDLWLGGFASPGQTILTCYLAAALICILKVLDIFLDTVCRAVFNAFRILTPDGRQSAAQGLRVILLFAVGLPYMIVAAATYRPRTVQSDVSRWFDSGANSISFQSTDGLKIAGLWMPAGPLSGIFNPHWGRQTVILCPGARAGRATYFTLAREFLDHGYNVLSFDFRGYGDSEGQISSFGDHERRDVLGAVRWLRTNHASASRRIVAVGVDTGAAALVAAAADASQEGRAIDALALLGCYDRFAELVSGTSLPLLQWPVAPIGLPLASIQTGANLMTFAPEDLVSNIAPRPILFIHGKRDPVITFERGWNLFHAASAPKSHIWLDTLTDEQAANDPAVAARIRRFLDTALPML